MADEPASALANQRTQNCRSVTNVGRDVPQSFAPTVNGNQVRAVKYGSFSSRYPISHGRSPQRVFHVEGHERHSRDPRRGSRLDGASLADRKASDSLPRCSGRENRAARPLLQAADVVRVGMRDHDRIGVPERRFREPVTAAVDDHPATPIADRKGGVLGMLGGARVDIAACPQEVQFHVESTHCENRGGNTSARLWQRTLSHVVVTAQRPHGAGLRALVTQLLGKGHLRADLQCIEAAAQHAVGVKIDLAAVGRFDEAVTFLGE